MSRMIRIRDHLDSYQHEEGRLDLEDKRFEVMADILQELPEAIHPTNGIYNIGNHDDEYSHIGQGLLDAFTPKELLNLQELITHLELAIIKKDNIYPQVFVMTYMMNVFETYIMDKYHLKSDQKAARRWPTAEGFLKTRKALMVPWDDPTPEMMANTILDACRIEAQQTIQTFAHYGIPGFLLDGRGFIGVDSQHVPEECNMFMEFLDQNVNEMGAKKRIVSDDGRTNEEQISDNITDVIAKGGLVTPEVFKRFTVNDDIDIDSDDNDDEVVLW